MSEMAAGIVLIIAVDAVLFVTARTLTNSVQTQSEKGLSIALAVGCCMIALAVHFAGIIAAGILVGDTITIAFASVLTGAAPATAFAVLLIESVSTRTTSFLTGSSGDAKEVIDLSLAQALVLKGDLDGAMKEYELAASMHPSSPDPLFGIEHLLIQLRRHDQAVDVCRDIINKFGQDTVVWIKASRHLAELLREHLDDPGGADFIERAIDLRAPEHHLGHIAERGSAQRNASKKSKPARQTVHDLNHARRLVEKGETDNAVAVFRAYARANPGASRPLFEAATALEKAQRYSEALSLLQETVRTFSDDDRSWGEAVLRMATLFQNHLDDRGAALGVLNEVLKRIPGTEHALIAQERLDSLTQSRQP